MKKLHCTFIYTVILLSSNVSASMDDIKGAFGINFGEVYSDKNNETCTTISYMDRRECTFKPTKPNKNFDVYTRTSTFSETKVTIITASKKMSSYEYDTCIEKAKPIVGALMRKYNTPFHIVTEKKQPKLTQLVRVMRLESTLWTNYDDTDEKGISVSCYRTFPKDFMEERYSTLRKRYELKSVKKDFVILKVRYFDKSYTENELLKVEEIKYKKKTDESGL